jgi:hypothetical protein
LNELRNEGETAKEKHSKAGKGKEKGFLTVVEWGRKK